MRRRYFVAATVCLIVLAVVTALTFISADIRERERTYRENGTKLNAVEMTEVDVSLWWSSYGWIFGPMSILGALCCAALIVKSRRRTHEELPVEMTRIALKVIRST